MLISTCSSESGRWAFPGTGFCLSNTGLFHPLETRQLTFRRYRIFIFLRDIYKLVWRWGWGRFILDGQETFAFSCQEKKAPAANSSPRRGKAIGLWKEANFVFDEKYNWTLKSCSSLEDLKGPWPETSLGYKTPSGLGRSLKNGL